MNTGTAVRLKLDFPDTDADYIYGEVVTIDRDFGAGDSAYVAFSDGTHEWCFPDDLEVVGKHYDHTRDTDRGPRSGKRAAYIFPDHRPGKHDAGNYLGKVASNGMAYTS